MSCTTSVAWSRRVSSPCYTEHGQRCGAVLSARITTVVMSRSGQLSLRCTVEPNCSGISARLASASVTRARALDTYEPSWVLGEVRTGPRGSVGPHLDREARSGAEEHVTASELSFRGDRAQSHGTRGSAEAHLGREASSGAEEHEAASELNSARRRSLGPRDIWQHWSSPQ
jgi:hypothetical protein